MPSSSSTRAARSGTGSSESPLRSSAGASSAGASSTGASSTGARDPAAGRSRLARGRIGLCLGAAALALLPGCYRAAPDLPPDYSSVDATVELRAEDFAESDLRLTCAQIVMLKSKARDRIATLEQRYLDERERERVEFIHGYGDIMDDTTGIGFGDAADISVDQGRFDTLLKLERFKGCQEDGIPRR